MVRALIVGSALALGAYAAGASETAFVQPGLSALAKLPVRSVGALESAPSQAELFQGETTEGTGARGLLFGVVLGLVVGLTGVGAANAKATPTGPAFPFVAAPAGVDLIDPAVFQPSSPAADAVAPDSCVLSKGCTKDQMNLYAKAQAAKLNVPRLTQDVKYGKPSTGSGRYKQFDLDFASPLNLPIDAEGKYTLTTDPLPKDQKLVDLITPYLAKGPKDLAVSDAVPYKSRS
mmetsp:Transcript_67995/g.148119  ORF Transcript_67995/g.148119 Transcript_67995/m.148119 type:complete len:233 (-) Transcript_67995:113-811(-)